MKYLVVAVVLLMTLSSFSQSINDYEYVIIPEQYSFAENVDEYQLNSLTQFLFNKFGFQSFRERDNKPFILKVNDCNVLYADVESNSSFLSTKLKVILKDCNDKVIFISEEGKSKNKDYKKSYHEALRSAFISIQELKYKYNGNTHENTKPDKDTAPKAQEVEVVEEVVTPKEEEVIVEVEEQEVVEVKEVSSIIGTYQSVDGFYKLVVVEDNLTIFEGKQKIGTAIINDNKKYEVLTTQFSGKGYFKNDTFIVDRIVKGVGVVQMIFSKN